MSKHDWFILPIIAITTVVVMVCGAEGAARLIWAEDVDDRCMMEAEHNRPKVNCTAFVKTAEGPWVEDRYNECGNRATGPCGPVQQGGSRIAVIGSSTSFGYLVSFDRVWSVETARTIIARCHQPVDVQSIIAIKPDRSGFTGKLNDLVTVLSDAIKLHPQLIAMVIAPFDLLIENGFDQEADDPPAPTGLFDYAKSIAGYSRAMTVMQHFMFRDANYFATTYLRYGDKAAFMRPPLSAEWQARLSYLDAALGSIGTRAKAAGIPLVLIFAPQQAQAFIIAENMSIPGVDAEALDRAIADIAARHNILFADGGPAFRQIKNAPDYFYQVDGHLNDAGQTLLGQTVADTLMSAHLPGLCQKS